MKVMKLIRNLLGPNSLAHAEYVAKGNPDYDVLKLPHEFLPLVLVGKLHEEAEEIREDMSNPEEYADALQVLQDLAFLNYVPWSEVEFAQRQKVCKKGAFTSGKVLSR